MVTLAASLALLSFQPTLLDNVRKALTVESGTQWAEARLDGVSNYYGEPHEYQLSFKPDGSFVQIFKGPVGETFGYDGKTFWRIERSRAVSPMDLGDRDRIAAIGLVLTSSWLTDNTQSKLSADGSTITLTLQPSGMKETIIVDPKTSLPTEARFHSSAGSLVLKVGNWKPAGNRLVPTEVAITEGGLTDTIKVKEVADKSGASFTIPEWKPTDFVFEADKPSRIEAKRAISGHVLVHPLVNGKDVGWFILDSGAEIMCIDSAAADELKLKKVGRVGLTGVGGTITSTFRDVPDFKLGPATVQRILFAEFDLGEIGRLLGIKLAGIVGGDFFRRSIVTMDLGATAVDVYPRDGFTLKNGSWRSMRFSNGNPAIEAKVDGAPSAWYRFDTGADGTVTFHAPFVKMHKLMEGKKTTASASGGVGGVLTSQAGKVSGFELAGHRFENPSVIFATANSGAFADPYLAGNIGQEFMQPFTIVLDFTGNRIALVKKK